MTNPMIELLSQARTLSKDENWQQAQAVWQNVLGINPDNYEARLGLGIARAKSGDTNLLEDYFLKLDKDHPERPQALVQLAGLSARNNDWQTALSLWKQLVERFPDRGDFRREYAYSLALQGENEEALDAFMASCESEENKTMLRTRWMSAIRQMNSADHALRHWHAINNRFPGDADILREYASSLIKADQVENALDKLNEIARRHPGDIRALIGIVKLHERLPDADEDDLVREWNALAEQFPGNPDVLEGRLNFVFAARHYDQYALAAHALIEAKPYHIKGRMVALHAAIFSQNEIEAGKQVSALANQPFPENYKLMVRQSVVLAQRLGIDHVMEPLMHLVGDSTVNPQSSYGVPAPSDVIRTTLHPDATLLRHQQGEPSTLIILFTGFPFPQETPMDKMVWGPLIDTLWGINTNYNLAFLCIRDGKRMLGLEGCPYFGDNYENTINGIKAYASTHGYSQILSIGVSAGGYPALRYGIDLGADRILAFAPPTNCTMDAIQVDRLGLALVKRIQQRVPRLAVNLRDHFKANPEPPTTCIVYSEHAKRDSWHAKNMAGLPGLQLLELAGSDDHNVLEVVQQQGKLPGLLSDFISGNGLFAASV